MAASSSDTRCVYRQIHIDVARNATDDFNPFHDGDKWTRIRGNPFGGPIVLGFQLECLAEALVTRMRIAEGDAGSTSQLRFRNYQFTFAGALRVDEPFTTVVKPTLRGTDASGQPQVSNRIAMRKGSGLVLLGHVRDSLTPQALPGESLPLPADVRLEQLEDRCVLADNGWFHKRKFMSNSNTFNLLEACAATGVRYFVFSSTAAVYGIPDTVSVAEDAPLQPINPYGASKMMSERMLMDLGAASDLRYVSLRYFNVAGADPEGRLGQATPDATHLIKVACQAATGQRDGITVFGTDYATRDGTCERDYIHVEDLAAAHVRALEHLDGGGNSQVLNCGYGHAYSVLEVLNAVKRASGVDFHVTLGPRREGDPPALMADARRIRQTLAWEPQYADLDQIVRHALAWEQKTALQTA
ncbi:UDP-glucose 4-epimerase GalE [Thioalkalivibrio sp. ALMg13-2]|uniref:UDP-glucose 4-epimerase GalE n=1 Tax=Thioalkalivibrio sp. ALMg13-2 TaxID=1158167 RepID=UPI00035C50A5|nr:UDP-glucose 4-epimerase GalE [Thioalkalivibrio sp. ALMg13-2]